MDVLAALGPLTAADAAADIIGVTMPPRIWPVNVGGEPCRFGLGEADATDAMMISIMIIQVRIESCQMLWSESGYYGDRARYKL